MDVAVLEEHMPLSQAEQTQYLLSRGPFADPFLRIQGELLHSRRRLRLGHLKKLLGLTPPQKRCDRMTHSKCYNPGEGVLVPKISEFFGIAIYVYYREHQPPHFHALYDGQEAQVSIESLSVMAGTLPPRAMGLAVEWASQHREELKRVWEQAMRHEPLSPIEPLK